MIVRRVGDGLVREPRLRLVRPPSVDHQVAIADPGMELDVGPPQRRLNGLDEHAALLVRDMPGGEIGQPAVVDRHEVAADGPVVGAQGHAHRRGLERCTPGVIALGVVTEEAQRGHIAGRQEPVGHVARPAHDSLPRHAVHRRQIRRLKRRLASERIIGLVRGTVGNHDHKFGRHGCESRYSSTPRQTLGAWVTPRRSISLRAARSLASMARWVMITSGTGLFSGALSPGSCWMTLAMLMPCAPRTCASAASTPGWSAIVNRR